MIRLIALVTSLVPLAVWADPPHFSTGGFNFQIQYGPGFWTVDQNKLGTDPGKEGLMVGPTNAQLFKESLQNTHTVSLSASYNILGHASVGADITATGWNLFDVTRGGGGFVIGKIAWHPIELFFLNKEKRPIGLDADTYFGVGYGIVGGATAVAGAPNGMDGLVFEWGLNANYYFARYFGLGLFARGVFLNWSKFYLDFNNRDENTCGGPCTLPLANPLGGSFWTFGISMTFRAGE